MKYLNEQTAQREIIERINKLTPQSNALWGKMNVAQMLTHCSIALEVPLGLLHPKSNLFGKLFGRYIKKVILEQRDFKRNLPTSPSFVVKRQVNFDEAKSLLLTHISKFSVLSNNELSKRKHPIGGNFSGEEWAWSQYKHLDHHLKQFGV
ncbi:MAG TPA: DUF1569 domain-containing protein [Bacteroidia bacterium]|jgi:hypothetical protein|nr:DUF1569 domain-containing protein [Bacteroidia bacterium]HNU32909.1 DUF1569 domain-containing protein [Bacteroidia bacterium]